MEKEISLSYKLAIDLIITAIVLGAVASFMILSNKAVLTHDIHKSVRKNTETYAELHLYDERILSGSDVVDIILTYSRIYDFEIEMPEGTKYFDSIAESEEINGKAIGLNLWKRENIEKALGKNINSRFVTTLKDVDGTYIVGLNFIEESQYDR